MLRRSTKRLDSLIRPFSNYASYFIQTPVWCDASFRRTRRKQLDAENSVAAATRCLEAIVRRFGDFVRETLAAPVLAGRVDLARDERVERCREAHKARRETEREHRASG